MDLSEAGPGQGPPKGLDRSSSAHDSGTVSGGTDILVRY